MPNPFGRVFSFAYPYHRWIALLSILAGALGFGASLLAGADWLATFGRGVNAGAAAFIAWTLARELDPPRQWTGLLAAMLGGLASLLAGPLALLPAALFLLLLRLVNRSPGRAFRPVDSLLVALGAIGVMVYSGQWLLGLAGALALAIDGYCDHKVRRRQWGWALMALMSSLVYLAWQGLPAVQPPVAFELGLAALAALLTTSRLLRYRRRGAGLDDRGQSFQFGRLALAIGLTWAIALTALWLGPSGLEDFGILWVALLGAGF